MLYFLLIGILLLFLVCIIRVAIRENEENIFYCHQTGKLIGVPSYYDEKLEICVDILPDGRKVLRGRQGSGQKTQPMPVPLIIPMR